MKLESRRILSREATIVPLMLLTELNRVLENKERPVLNSFSTTTTARPGPAESMTIKETSEHVLIRDDD